MNEEIMENREDTRRPENFRRGENGRRPRNKKQTETPVKTKLLTLQLLLGAVIILILFLISRSGGGVAQNISNFYSDIKKTDMAVSEVIGTIKNTAKETFAPINNIENAEEITEEITGEGE